MVARGLDAPTPTRTTGRTDDNLGLIPGITKGIMMTAVLILGLERQVFRFWDEECLHAFRRSDSETEAAFTIFARVLFSISSSVFCALSAPLRHVMERLPFDSPMHSSGVADLLVCAQPDPNFSQSLGG